MMAVGLLAALALAVAAPSTAGRHGLYVADMPETASALRLDADGRFEWFFSQGALDMVAEGRWEECAGTVYLASDPPVVPPRFTLLGTGRDDVPGLLVRVVNQAGEPAGNLDIAAERADGGWDRGFIQGGAYRFAPGQRIVALFLGSEVYDFISPRYAIAEGVNVVRFQFEANDVGKADFRDLPVTISSKGLDMTWRGLALSYARAEEPGK